MRRSAILLTGICVSALALSSPALAGPKNNKARGHSQTPPSQFVETRDYGAVVVFTEDDRDIVEHYFSNPKHLPPGLAKKSDLPPGLQKYVWRTGHLPPGLEKRALPDELSYRLPKLDARYERTIVGHDMILLDSKTGLILDVMQDIFDVPVDATLQKVGAHRVDR